MSLTPHRDAAKAIIKLTRHRFAEQGTTDPVRCIAERMNVDTCAAILMGMGEMRDLDTSSGRIGVHVNESLASAWASALLTITGGDIAAARSLILLGLHDLRDRTERCIAAAPTHGIYADVQMHPWNGRA